MTGDSTYGALEVVRGLEDAGIRAYVPLRDDDKRSTFFGKRHFTFDAYRDVYRCPQDAILCRVGMSRLDRTTRYQADAEVCNACPCKHRCTTSDSGRAVTRHVDAAYHDKVRSYEGTTAYQTALRKRAVWAEPLFGEAKQWHHLGRFRLRGLGKVNSEALLTATGQNLKRLLSASGWGRRPFPGGACGVVVPATAGDAASWH